MNNAYYNSNTFPGNPIYSGNMPTPNQEMAPNFNTVTSTQANQIEMPIEQSYIENILRLNKGKQVRVHMTFPDSNEFRDREFSGIIEQSGRDHIIISEPSTGKWQLLLMIYVDFITFDEKINYSQEFIPNR